MTGDPLLRVEHLRKHYRLTKGVLFAKTLGEVKAVDVSTSAQLKETKICSFLT